MTLRQKNQKKIGDGAHGQLHAWFSLWIVTQISGSGQAKLLLATMGYREPRVRDPSVSKWYFLLLRLGGRQPCPRARRQLGGNRVTQTDGGLLDYYRRRRRVAVSCKVTHVRGSSRSRARRPG